VSAEIPPPAAAGYLSQLWAIFTAFVVGLAGWAWKHTHKRIDDKADRTAHQEILDRVDGVEETIEREVKDLRLELREKAEKEEMERLRGHIEKLYIGQGELAKTMASEFANLTQRVNDAQITLLDRINSLKKG
jgi:hypothetical protein